MCLAHFRLKNPSASGYNVLSEVVLFSGCASAENACVAAECQSPARGQGVEQSCRFQSVAPGVRFRRADEAVVKPWEHHSRCQGMEMGEQSEAAIKTHPAPLCTPLQVSGITDRSSIALHGHPSSALFSLGSDPLALASRSQCGEGLLLRELPWRWGLCFREQDLPPNL